MDRIKRAFKRIFVIKKGQEYVHRNRRVITAKTKPQIFHEMGERREQIWREEVRRGKLMDGHRGHIDLERAQEAQDENMRKQQLILHPKQEDVLLFNQNRSRGEKALSLPRIGEKAEEHAKEKQKAALATITPTDQKEKAAELPSVFTRIE